METKKEGFEIKPLSVIKYFSNNKRRSISMIMAVAVSVVMIIVFQMIGHVVMESGKFAIVKRLERMTVIYPGEEGTISQQLIEKVKGSADVDKLVPMYVETTDYYHFFGNLNIPMYIVGEEDVDYILQRLNISLKEGRMPQPGKNEILLDWRTANNKNRKLGDFIGREVDSMERMPGKYEIVGILEGDILIAIYPIESGKLVLENGILAFPKPQRLEAFNSILEGTPKEEARYQTTEYGKEIFKESEKNLSMLTGIVAIAILFVMSFAAGNASYAQYFSRRYEFGILQSLGYNKVQILLRAAKEIVFTSAAGLLLGIIISMLIGIGGLRLYFESKGYPFVLVNVDGLIQVFIVPICTVVCSLIPSAWILSKVDPMLIIEKFE